MRKSQEFIQEQSGQRKERWEREISAFILCPQGGRGAPPCRLAPHERGKRNGCMIPCSRWGGVQPEEGAVSHASRLCSTSVLISSEEFEFQRSLIFVQWCRAEGRTRSFITWCFQFHLWFEGGWQSGKTAPKLGIFGSAEVKMYKAYKCRL